MFILKTRYRRSPGLFGVPTELPDDIFVCTEVAGNRYCADEKCCWAVFCFLCFYCFIFFEVVFFGVCWVIFYGVYGGEFVALSLIVNVFYFCAVGGPVYLDSNPKIFPDIIKYVEHACSTRAYQILRELDPQIIGNHWFSHMILTHLAETLNPYQLTQKIGFWEGIEPSMAYIHGRAKDYYEACRKARAF